LVHESKRAFLIAATVVERAELLEVLAAQDCVIDF